MEQIIALEKGYCKFCKKIENFDEYDGNMVESLTFQQVYHAECFARSINNYIVEKNELFCKEDTKGKKRMSIKEIVDFLLEDKSFSKFLQYETFWILFIRGDMFAQYFPQKREKRLNIQDIIDSYWG